MAAVDEHRQADRRGRPNSRSASIAARTVRPVYRTSSTSTTVASSISNGTSVPFTCGRVAEPRVVAVELDVERADGDVRALVLRDRLGEAARERDAAALDADEHEPGRAGLLLDDLVGDADHRPADLVRRS